MKRFFIGMFFGIVICVGLLVHSGHMTVASSYKTISYNVPKIEGVVIR